MQPRFFRRKPKREPRPELPVYARRRGVTGDVQMLRGGYVSGFRHTDGGWFRWKLGPDVHLLDRDGKPWAA